MSVGKILKDELGEYCLVRKAGKAGEGAMRTIPMTVSPSDAYVDASSTRLAGFDSDRCSGLGIPNPVCLDR